MDPLNPLDQTHLDQINAQLKAGENAKAALHKAGLAGIDVAAHERQLDDALARLRTIKTVYFPGR